MNDLQADGAARRIAVLLPNWIGDCVMATPCLRAMRRRFPIPHEIIGVMQPYVADVLRGTSWLDQVVLYDRKSPDSVRRFGGVARGVVSAPGCGGGSASVTRKRISKVRLLTSWA